TICVGARLLLSLVLLRRWIVARSFHSIRDCSTFEFTESCLHGLKARAGRLFRTGEKIKKCLAVKRGTAQSGGEDRDAIEHTCPRRQGGSSPRPSSCAKIARVIGGPAPLVTIRCHQTVASPLDSCRLVMRLWPLPRGSRSRPSMAETGSHKARARVPSGAHGF